jgi:hypothetical protein
VALEKHGGCKNLVTLGGCRHLDGLGLLWFIEQRLVIVLGLRTSDY